MILHKSNKIPLKRGHKKKGHNFPLQNQQKRTTYNIPHTTWTDTYNTQDKTNKLKHDAEQIKQNPTQTRT